MLTGLLLGSAVFGVTGEFNTGGVAGAGFVSTATGFVVAFSAVDSCFAGVGLGVLAAAGSGAFGASCFCTRAYKVLEVLSNNHLNAVQLCLSSTQLPATLYFYE